MKNLLYPFVSLCVVCASPISNAQCSHGGFKIPPSVHLKGYQNPALLNGFGARTKLLWDVYITALYLPTKTQDPETVLMLDGPKRLSIYFSHDVPKEKLIEGWQDGFVNNNSTEQLDKLQQRLDDSYTYLRDMVVGDVIQIDQHPEKGSLLWINGELTHSVPGDDYFQAILKIWLGKKPAQEPLKHCLLGLSGRP